MTRPHIVDGEFQSDRYPTCPRGKVPLSVKDATAQDLLWEYAQRRRVVDSEFADDLEFALRAAGFELNGRPGPPPPRAPGAQWREIRNLRALCAVAEDWFRNPTGLDWEEIRFVMDGIRRVCQ